MDGMSTSISAGIAGSLAAQPSASQASVRRQREARRQEAAGPADAEVEASDAPVEQPDEPDAVSSNLPRHLDARPDAEPSEKRPHIDLTA